MLLTLVLLTAAVAPSLLLGLALGAVDRPWLTGPSLRSSDSLGRPMARGPRSPWSTPARQAGTDPLEELRWVL
ncbi:MAG: hypothetical protein ISQ08_04845 [Planctomycetes bacterium]|nr:hypothetical protein [Planctomycetota bacterium]